MGTPDISAAIIGRNGLGYLKKCVDAVRRSGTHFSEILYVDDASTDGSPAWIADNHPEVRVLALKERKGPSHTRNEGIALARSGLVLLIDCDACPAPDCAGLLAEKISQVPQAVLAVPRIMLEGTDTVQHGGGRCHFLGLSVFPDAWRKIPSSTPYPGPVRDPSTLYPLPPAPCPLPSTLYP
ncbi:MAG: glycosyltransferase family 2 protein, partial [bacterium]